MSRREWLELRNPHAVLAALEGRPQDVAEVCLPPRGAGEAWSHVAEAAATRGIPVVTAAPERPAAPDKRGGGKPERKEGRSGMARARVLESPQTPLDEVLAGVSKEDHGLWLALDRIQDPRNLGAIFRSAAFYGVRGAVMTTDQTAPLTAVAHDTACGGFEHVPFTQVTNLARTLEKARDAGLWLLGAAEQAERDVSAIARDRSWLLIVGNEEKGLRRLSREACDDLCRLTPHGKVGSLNVSVATAVLLATLAGVPG